MLVYREMALDVSSIRQSFPLLHKQIDGNPVVYLDSAATSQKPQEVIDAMKHFYEEENSNVHRGMHALAERATVAFEDARKSVQEFINATKPEEIIFTKGSTESVNLVAKTFGQTLMKGEAPHSKECSLSPSASAYTSRNPTKPRRAKADDAIVLSIMEHHSNIVPWLQLKEEKGIEINWIDIDDEGNLKLDELDAYLAKGNVKLVSITGLSNVLGVRPPLKEIITKAHTAGALVLVDAAQLVMHHPVDVQDLDCDFLAFSGHKLYGPTGIGALYGKRALLAELPPFLGGGDMIHEVKKDGFTCADIPQKFEAGTPPIAQAIGLGIAIKWLRKFSWDDIAQHEKGLLAYALDQLSTIDGLTIFGPKDPDVISGCVSFVVEGIHPHDLTDILGQKGICLRGGHHCTQPLHERLKVPATARLCVSIYNEKSDIDALIKGITEAQTLLSK